MEQPTHQQQQPGCLVEQQLRHSDRLDGLGKPLLSIAPMMDYTDVHYRQLARLISKHTWLWTEMVVDKTILHAEPLDKQLWFPPEQHPIVLQLGGSDPQTLHEAMTIAARYGYDEINLNCGCPSDRVAGAGCFGASLMLEPQLVADCMAAVAAGAAAGGASPRTSVKCRLGVDDADSYAQLAAFVQTVSEHGGVTDFIIHARKCLLNGISPAQNRSVPPLRHDWVWALKRDFPHLSFQLNGGITTIQAAAQALSLSADATFGVGPGAIDGVMIGRAAYSDPWGVLGDADVALFGAQHNAATCRREVVARYVEFADGMLGRWRKRDDGSVDPNIRTLMKPLLNLFHGERGGKRWKNAVDTELRTTHPTTLSQLMDATLGQIPDAVLDAPPRPAAEAAAYANNGVLPPPYALAVERLAVGEDRARGDKEPRGKARKVRVKRKQQESGSAGSSCCGSDTEADAAAQPQQEAQQQQQQQQQQEVLLQANGVDSLQQQLHALSLKQQQQQDATSPANNGTFAEQQLQPPLPPPHGSALHVKGSDGTSDSREEQQAAAVVVS